jgi:hypothetical protein
MRLLRQLHKYLSKSEQSKLCGKLQVILVKSEESAADENGVIPEIGSNKHSKFETGVPLLRKIIPIMQAARKVPIKHPKADWDLDSTTNSKAKKVFIYNPYEQKSVQDKEEVMLVVGELAYFDVILANPFSFELDVQSISLNTSGIGFKPLPAEIIIPAATRAYTVRLSGIALEAGKLKMHGCHVRMLGGCIDEDIVHLSDLLRPFRLKDGKYRKQTPKERIYGRHKLKFIGGKSGLDDQSISISNNQTEWYNILTL